MFSYNILQRVLFREVESKLTYGAFYFGKEIRMPSPLFGTRTPMLNKDIQVILKRNDTIYNIQITIYM